MKKNLTLLLVLLGTLIACGKVNQGEVKLRKSVYQYGEDKEALWAYIGFVPRVSSPENLTLTISKKGFTMRAHAKFTKEEISNYASYIVKKAVQMERARQGFKMISWHDGTYSAPFEVMEKRIYNEYLKTIKDDFIPVAQKYDGDYWKNYKLLKKFFKENLEVKGNYVYLTFVYPITTGKGNMSYPLHNFAWIDNNPSPGNYNIYHFEERRTHYSIDNTHIFAGFSAFWFNGDIGIHGPIAYTKNNYFLQGNSDKNVKGNKPVHKRWQLVRTAASHNCIRMESLQEIRHLMPAQKTRTQSQPLAEQVKITVTDDYDRFDYDFDGDEDVMGVKYYWSSPSTIPNEQAWKAAHYKRKIKRLKEYEYRPPQLVQLRALPGVFSDNFTTKGVNPTATAALLNRLPQD